MHLAELKTDLKAIIKWQYHDGSRETEDMELVDHRNSSSAWLRRKAKMLAVAMVTVDAKSNAQRSQRMLRLSGGERDPFYINLYTHTHLRSELISAISMRFQ